VFIAATVGVACRNPRDDADAKALVARHFDAIARQAYDLALADYGSQFFARFPRDEWKSTLGLVERKLGTFQKYEIVGSRWKSQLGAHGGLAYEFVCRVSYSKSEAEEILSVFRASGSPKFQILGHRINSNALLKD
jgi:hypothetical protein